MEQEEAPKKYSLHRAVLVLMLTYVVILGAAIFHFSDDFIPGTGRSEPVNVSAYLGGKIMGGFILGYLLSYTGYLIARRSRKVGNIVFVLVTTLFFLDTLGATVAKGRAGRDRKNHAALDQVQDALAVGKEEMKRQIEETGTYDPAKVKSNRVAEALEKASGEMTGDEAVFMRVAAEVQSEMQQMAVEFSAAMAKFNELGGIDTSQLRVSNNIEDRLIALKGLVDQNTILTAYIGAMDAKYREKLTTAGVKDETVNEMVASVTRNIAPRRKTLLQIRKQDEIFLGAAGELLGVLKDYWLEWDFDEERAQIIFLNETPDEIVNKYNDCIARIQSSAEQQAQLRRQLVGDAAPPAPETEEPSASAEDAQDEPSEQPAPQQQPEDAPKSKPARSGSGRVYR